MNLRRRGVCVSEKFKYFSEEIFALKEESLGYQIGFGLLLAILFPVFVFELLIVILFGKDFGMFVRPEPVLPPVLNEEEVPESLRGLIPLAKKFGISDDGDRGEIMKITSFEELLELEKMVLPRQQEITDWLDTFPEHEISDTAAFFLYLGSACDEVPLYRSHEEIIQSDKADG